MTSVVAAGNGSLSNSFYRGLAPDSDVVLVKLARTGRITEDDIQKGLEWVLENREKFNIRIVNISAGGDYEQSYLDDSLSQTVERCTAEGITIVCAVGNAGHLPNHPVFPPASAPLRSPETWRHSVSLTCSGVPLPRSSLATCPRTVARMPWPA